MLESGYNYPSPSAKGASLSAYQQKWEPYGFPFLVSGNQLLTLSSL